jgi:hypothetical protein
MNESNESIDATHRTRTNGAARDCYVEALESRVLFHYKKRLNCLHAAISNCTWYSTYWSTAGPGDLVT